MISVWHPATGGWGTKGRDGAIDGCGLLALPCFVRTAHFVLGSLSQGTMY